MAILSAVQATYGGSGPHGKAAMADVLLSHAKQVALRRLLAAEPVPGRALPGEDVLEQLVPLIPCDALGIALVDPQGWVLDRVHLPRGIGSAFDPCTGPEPLELGIVHRGQLARLGAPRRAASLTDRLSLGFRNGRRDAVQVWFGRTERPFGERDVALLWMLAPTLQRLVRDPASPPLAVDLTLSERRTLSLVAAGFSNPEIAERMNVATCTVRKHLEHAYRKLGVKNRLAATTALQGGPRPQGTGSGRLPLADDSRESEWPGTRVAPMQVG